MGYFRLTKFAPHNLHELNLRAHFGVKKAHAREKGASRLAGALCSKAADQ